MLNLRSDGLWSVMDSRLNLQFASSVSVEVVQSHERHIGANRSLMKPLILKEGGTQETLMQITSVFLLWFDRFLQ